MGSPSESGERGRPAPPHAEPPGAPLAAAAAAALPPRLALEAEAEEGLLGGM